MEEEGAIAARDDARYLRRVLDGSRSVTAVIGLDGVVSYASAGLEELLGVSAEEAVGASVFDWLHPEDLDRAAVSLVFTDEVRSIRYFPMTFRLRRGDGGHVELDVLVANHLDDPVIRGIVLDLRSADDRTQFVEPIRALASGASHDEVLESIAGGVGRGGEVLRPALIASERSPVTGRYGRLHAVRAPEAMVAGVRAALDDVRPGSWADLAARELRAVPCAELPPALAEPLAAGDYVGVRVGAVGADSDVEALLIAAEHRETWQDGRWSPSMEDHWGQLLDLAWVAFQRHRDETRLRHAAHHDAMTGLANRERFFRQLERMAARTDVAVLYLDLDEFKSVNDRFGHASGDAVLVEVARRLSDTVRPGDLVARLGGDEFAVAVADPQREVAADLATRLMRAIAGPLPSEHPVDGIGVSIGLAHRQPGQSVDDLVNAADRALLDAKRRGRGRVVAG